MDELVKLAPAAALTRPPRQEAEAAARALLAFAGASTVPPQFTGLSKTGREEPRRVLPLACAAR